VFFLSGMILMAYNTYRTAQTPREVESDSNPQAQAV
jgi:cbb3-type cytochrome oxidase subunit 1